MEEKKIIGYKSSPDVQELPHHGVGRVPAREPLGAGRAHGVVHVELLLGPLQAELAAAEEAQDVLVVCM